LIQILGNKMHTFQQTFAVNGCKRAYDIVEFGFML
jgi:hypothetical protein